MRREQRTALALSEEGRLADAQAELEALLAATPNHSQAWAALAVCLYKQGRAREALTELDRAAAVHPADGPELRKWFSARTR